MLGFMINQKVQVTYYHNNKTGEWCQNAPDKYGNEYYDDLSINNYWNYEDYKKDSDDPAKSPNRKRFWSIKKHIFNKFTNKGKLSKSELKGLSIDEAKIFKANAEKQLAEILKIEKSTNVDMEKALKLVNIVNSTNWDNLTNKDFAIIKVKTSHSKWYKHTSNKIYTPSEYLTLVPVVVAKQAKELQAIRRKHQNDPTFDFNKTNYKTKTVRVADHENHGNYADIDSTKTDWTKLYNY